MIEVLACIWDVEATILVSKMATGSMNYAGEFTSKLTCP